MQIDLLDSVKTFIETLNETEIAKVIRTIELLEEFENKLGMPHSKHIDNGLLELRIRGKREIRIFYCFNKNKAVLLHVCVKKTQKTPVKELHKAITAKNDLS